MWSWTCEGRKVYRCGITAEHLDGSQTGQTSFLFTNPFSVFVLFLLLLQATLLLRSLLPLLQRKDTDTVNSSVKDREGRATRRRARKRSSPGEDGYLSFTGQDAFEGRLIRQLFLGVASVPALDGDRGLVHLLNEPSDTPENHF